MLPRHDNPDPELLRRARAGERKAFLALCRRHAAVVRAIVEARIPGSPRIDEETAAAFARTHKMLVLVQDPGWFHLFVTRTTRAWLDARGHSAEDPGAAAPPWARKLSLSQREALYFHARALQAGAPFPAIEYLAISNEAFATRVARGRALLARESAGIGPPPPDGLAERIAARVDELLGPAPAERPGRSLPRLPLSLSFLLAIALAALASALLFRPPARAEERPFEARFLEAGVVHEPLNRVRVELSPGSRAELIAPDRLRLDSGELRLTDGGHAPLLIEIGGRLFRPGHGRFRLRATGQGFSILPERGRGSLGFQAANGRRIRQAVDLMVSW
ncbi:MAG: hypothetical protein ACE5F1_02685 [Planctomycetota bacterium]